MELLQYPFDARQLMRRKKALRNELLSKGGLMEKRIAVLGGSTTHDIVEFMELFLLDRGIKPAFYESGYARYWEDAMFGGEALDSFKPDVVFVHTTSRNIQAWPELGMADAEIDDILLQTFGRYEAMWTKLIDKFKCPVIQNNFELLPYRLLGNLDAVDAHGRVNFIRRLNALFAEWARTHSGLFINDINWQAADFGLSRWHDPFCWYMYKYALSLEAMPTLAFNVSNIVKSIFGKNKKAIAVDLDDTLWGGVVGEDGPENIAVGPDTPLGEAYADFQRYLKGLQRRGVLLAVVSKNDESAAKGGLAHPQMVLKEDDFSSIKANWNPKSQNIADIADELSLLPESFVFIDDNPAEREIVRRQLPECSVLEMTKVERYVETIDRGGYFEATALSADDFRRGAMYKESIERARRRSDFSDYGEYLKSLGMRASIRPFDAASMGRIAQLTNKANQFNLTARRFTQEEIGQMADDSRYITRYGSLCDKFGDSGVVAVSVGEMNGEVCEFILWLMSCRALKRDMELAMMDAMVEAAIERGAKTVRGIYRRTQKNAMVADFYASQGFAKVSEDNNGDTVWELDVSRGYKRRNLFIEVGECLSG